MCVRHHSKCNSCIVMAYQMGHEIVYGIKSLIGKNRSWLGLFSESKTWHFTEGLLDGLSGCALMIFKQASSLFHHVTDSLLPIHASDLVQKSVLCGAITACLAPTTEGS